MNATTYKKLDLDRVQETLAAHCFTSLGKSLARRMAPSTNSHTVEHWLTQVRELAKTAQKSSLPPMGGIHDIRDYVRASAFPAPLEPDALAQIAVTLEATAVLCKWFSDVAETVPSLGSVREQICDFSSIAEAIHQAIDPRGKVHDLASPKLASIRGAIARVQTRIREVFDRLLRHASVTRMLQYAGATFHNDRMVLPLKADHRGRIAGIIHRSSDTGATLFVEPEASVELNNTLARQREEEIKEVTRILQLLTARVRANADAILATLRAVGVLDLVAAKCRYAAQRGCVCPQMDERGLLELFAARHPWLVELFEQEALEGKPLRQVVPIDIRLGDDFDVLVVTGPNTGGKTVTLKTVGALALMTQCGIPIPAGPGSRMPVYRQIFIDIGDEQSLQQSLSTFSSHLANLLEMIGHSGGKSLVLIDELGAGTDPDEGAAIGQAIVSELLRLKARAVVSTHISALKALAFTTPRVQNAAVEFDPESLRPTYRLRLGEPGNSNALIIARRLGMPDRLVEDAEKYLGNRTRALNQAIAGTLQSRREAEEARRAAHEAKLRSLQELDRLQKRCKEMEQTKKAFDDWTAWVNALRPGDPVYVKPLKRGGTLVRLELHKQRALIAAGAIEMELALSQIAFPLLDG